MRRTSLKNFISSIKIYQDLRKAWLNSKKSEEKKENYNNLDDDTPLAKRLRASFFRGGE
jgi:hypothetical protein